VFLKFGVDVTGVEFMTEPSFFRIKGDPDPDKTRLLFGKSFIYPLFAAPFVSVFDLNGFLWFNALLLAGTFLASYTFVGARSGTIVSLALASAFVFATVVPVYYAWMMPELFNFTLGVLAYFCWLYKYVGAPVPSRPRTAWLRGAWGDVLAAVILGIATYSKVTNLLLFAPIPLWFVLKRDWHRVVIISTLFGATVGGLFAANVAVSGDWNYQGGLRRTFYQNNGNLGRAYPFQQPGVGFEAGKDMGRNDSLFDVLMDHDLFWPNLRSNIKYFVVGRYGGLLPYFFPAVLATLMFLFARGRRELWQWFVLAAVVLHIAVFILSQPYTYLGSGGSIGNRYFMGAYGLSLFLFPPIRTMAVPMLAWAVGATFVGKMVLHPFVSSLEPFQPAKNGLLRILPIELTNLLGLPVMTQGFRVRLWYGDTGAGDRGFQVFHFDDNAYLPEEGHKSFWIRGKSRAEMVFKTDTAVHYRIVNLHLTAGAVATDVTVTLNGKTSRVSLTPGQELDLRLPLGSPFVYGFNKMETGEVNWLWVISIESSNGFTPPAPVDGSRADVRYLGVLVKPTVWPGGNPRRLRRTASASRLPKRRSCCVMRSVPVLMSEN